LAEPRDSVRSAGSGDLAEARLDVRFAGYCGRCDRIVERAADGSCPKGHPADAITGCIPLFDDDPIPGLPRFNVAAFFLPFVWGPAHHEWAGLIFLPIWLLMDGIVAAASRGGIPQASAAIVAVTLTLLLQAFFAKRANGAAFRRVIRTMTAEEFVRRQSLWAIASAPLAILLLAWAVWFDVTVAPTIVH
jgi:hypothetical protein